MLIPAGKRTTRFGFLFFIVTILGVACSDILDTSDYELEKIKVNPDIAIPLAFGDLSIEDLLSAADSDFIKVYPDGLVYLMYESSMTSRDIRDMIKFPDQTFNQDIPVIPGTLAPRAAERVYAEVSIDQGFSFAPEKITEIKFKAGAFIQLTIDFTPSEPAGSTFELELELPNFTLDGVPLKRRVSNGLPTTIQLANYVASLDDNQFAMKLSLIEKAHSGTVVITPLTNARMSARFRFLDFYHVRGFMGDRTPSILRDMTINLGAFGSTLSEAQVSFANPKLEVAITNEYGIPTRVHFNPFEVRKNDGSSLPIEFTNPNPVVIQAPATMGESATTSVGIANIGEVFDFAPDDFHFQVGMRINEGMTAGENFITDTSKLTVDVKVEIPIHGRAGNIALSDTFDIDMEDIQQSEIESAKFRSIVENELPLEAGLQIYFADENYLITDSLFATGYTNIIEGSKVKANGELESAGVADIEIELSEAKLEKMFDAKHLIVRMAMYTSKEDDGTQRHVQFKSQYKIKLALGVQARLKLEMDL